MEEASAGKKLVRREVTRIVNTRTATDSHLLRFTRTITSRRSRATVREAASLMSMSPRRIPCNE